ncbi:MAG: hypothetical protein QW228_04035 [Candidatus Aenigmatarchaeota archaeon]
MLPPEGSWEAWNWKNVSMAYSRDAFERIKLMSRQHSIHARLKSEEKLFLAKEFKRFLKQTGNLVLFCGYKDK